jgi:CheY-like chemotaxis protein
MSESARKDADRSLKTRSPIIVHLDDEDLVREVAAAIIKTVFPNAIIRGFSVGEEAWQELQKSDPDLLISDRNHLGMDTCEMLRRMVDKRQQYPVLFVSGMAPADFEQYDRDCAGPRRSVTYFSKFYTPEQLKDYLLTHLGPSDNAKRQATRLPPGATAD